MLDANVNFDIPMREQEAQGGELELNSYGEKAGMGLDNRFPSTLVSEASDVALGI